MSIELLNILKEKLDVNTEELIEIVESLNLFEKKIKDQTKQMLLRNIIDEFEEEMSYIIEPETKQLIQTLITKLKGKLKDE